MSDERVCVVCGAALVRRPKEQLSSFRKRLTCSQACRAVRTWDVARTRIPALPERLCAVCGTALQPRPGEWRSQFQKRKTCGDECARQATSRGLRAGMTAKRCAVCGERFERRADEQASDYLARKTCSYACRNQSIAATKFIAAAPRACMVCGGMMRRRLDEQHADFLRRKTCSKGCQAIAQTSTMVERFAREARTTNIERATYAALRAMGMRYEAQHQIGRYRVDAYLPDLATIVECHGDYWHASPRRYPAPALLNDKQRRMRERDAKRIASLERAGYRVVVLWESEIKERGAEALLREALGMAGGMRKAS